MALQELFQHFPASLSFASLYHLYPGSSEESDCHNVSSKLRIAPTMPQHLQSIEPNLGDTSLQKPSLKVRLLPNHKKDDNPVLSVSYKFELGEGMESPTESHRNDIIALFKMNDNAVPRSVARVSIAAIQHGLSMERLQREGIFELRATNIRDTLHMEIPGKRRSGTYIVVYMDCNRRVLTCSSMITIPPRLFISKITRQNGLVVVDFEQEPAQDAKVQQLTTCTRGSSTTMRRAAQQNSTSVAHSPEGPVWIKLVNAANQVLSEKECTFFRPSTVNGLNAMGTASFRIPYTKCCGFRILLFDSESATEPVFISKWLDVHRVQVERFGSLIQVEVSLEDTSLCGKAWIGVYEMDGSTVARRSAWYSTIAAPKDILRWETSNEEKNYLICLYPGYFPINPIFEKVEVSPIANGQGHELPAHLADGL